MKSKTSTILRVVLIGFLLGQAGFLLAQPSDQDARTRYSDLKREQEKFLFYIEDAENEYEIATNRMAQNNELWQHNVVQADLGITAVKALMDGNAHFRGQIPKIAALKALLAEEPKKKELMNSYKSYRDQAYALEDKLRALTIKLAPANQQFVSDATGKIMGGQNPDEVMSIAKQIDTQVKIAEGNNTPVAQTGQANGGANGGGNPQPSPENQNGTVTQVTTLDPREVTSKFLNNSSDPSAQMDFEKILTSRAGPDPMTDEDAKKFIKCIQDGDIDGALAILRNYPRNPGAKAAMEKLLANNPGHLTKKQIKDLTDALESGNPGKIDTAVDAALSKTPVTQEATAGDGSPQNGSSNVTPTGKVVDKNGNLIVGDWIGADGRPKPRRILRSYTDAPGGQIDYELEQERKWTTNTEGNIVLDEPTEVAGSRIDWILNINEVSRVPAGDGFTVTFKLDNGGTPPNSEYHVTAWEGPDGKKESTDEQFTVTFPKAGDYTVKAYGTTGKYNNAFIISLQVKL